MRFAVFGPRGDREAYWCPEGKGGAVTINVTCGPDRLA
jgi:hypothetical protein